MITLANQTLWWADCKKSKQALDHFNEKRDYNNSLKKSFINRFLHNLTSKIVLTSLTSWKMPIICEESSKKRRKKVKKSIWIIFAAKKRQNRNVKLFVFAP
jgi:hypothetical protein